MAYSTSDFNSTPSTSTTDHAELHTRKYAGDNNHCTDSDRDHRSRDLWWDIQQLVGIKRSTVNQCDRRQCNVDSPHSRGRFHSGDSHQASRSCRADRHRQNHKRNFYYYLALYLFTVGTPVLADDVYNNAAPRSTATGNVTNQAVQFQNNGAPSRQNYGDFISCNGTTMTVTPFYMGNDSISDSYVRSNNWGFQVGFSVPLDGGQVERCKSIAKRQEEKMRLDYELVRALKCAEVQQKGFTFRPGSRVEHMCHDIVPISLITKNLK